MYQGRPTTQSGTLTMTTISLGSAFDGMGDAANGYRSKTFEKFCRSLDGFRERVEAQYAGATYPAGTALAGKPFDPANGTVSKYSADVMVPAFLSTYTSMGGKSLSIFPTLACLLPNWTMRYSGLVQLPWFRDVFKSLQREPLLQEHLRRRLIQLLLNVPRIHERPGLRQRRYDGQPRAGQHVQRKHREHKRGLLAAHRRGHDLQQQPYLQTGIPQDARTEPQHDQRTDKRSSKQRPRCGHELQDKQLQAIRRQPSPPGASKRQERVSREQAGIRLRHRAETDSTQTSTCASTCLTAARRRYAAT